MNGTMVRGGIVAGALAGLMALSAVAGPGAGPAPDLSGDVQVIGAGARAGSVARRWEGEGRREPVVRISDRTGPTYRRAVNNAVARWNELDGNVRLRLTRDYGAPCRAEDDAVVLCAEGIRDPRWAGLTTVWPDGRKGIAKAKVVVEPQYTSKNWYADYIWCHEVGHALGMDHGYAYQRKHGDNMVGCMGAYTSPASAYPQHYEIVEFARRYGVAREGQR